MKLRCAKFFLRGALWLRPVPYFRDYDCWSGGGACSFWLALVCVPIALVGGGIAIGRYL